jgi:hypothetical protein
MEYALIKNKKVENIIVADDDFAAKIAPKFDAVVKVNPGEANIGWDYDGTKIIVPPPPPVVDPGPDPRIAKKAKLKQDIKAAGFTAAQEDLLINIIALT